MSCNARHSCPRKSIKNNISRFSIMQNITHNCFIRHFCMVGMSIINGIVLTFTHIRRKWLPMIIVCCLIIRSAILLDEVLDEGIRAGSIKRCIRESDDILIRTDGKALDIAHFIYIFFGQLSAFHSCFLTFVF